jgi:rhodanese-related sulfurtransferase
MVRGIIKKGTKFVALLFLSMITFTNIVAQEIKEVNAETVKKTLVKDKNWVVLDVRTPGEFSQGHIPGALNIDLYQNDAITRIGKLDKNAKYIVYCRTRNRSGVVADYMVKNGFANVYQMVDGIGGWNRVKNN